MGPSLWPPGIRGLLPARGQHFSWDPPAPLPALTFPPGPATSPEGHQAPQPVTTQPCPSGWLPALRPGCVHLQKPPQALPLTQQRGLGSHRGTPPRASPAGDRWKSADRPHRLSLEKAASLRCEKMTKPSQTSKEKQRIWQNGETEGYVPNEGTKPTPRKRAKQSGSKQSARRGSGQ